MTNNEKASKCTDRKNRQVHEVMSLNVEAHPVEPDVFSAETAVDLLNDSLEDEYEDELRNYAQDDGIAEAFVERQTLNGHQNRLHKKMAQHNAESPVLSGGDVDSAWDQANKAGSETVGGSTATPGQNNIDDMGKAMGLTLERNEAPNISEKRRRKDEERWELEAASAEDTA